MILFLIIKVVESILKIKRFNINYTSVTLTETYNIQEHNYKVKQPRNKNFGKSKVLNFDPLYNIYMNMYRSRK